MSVLFFISCGICILAALAVGLNFAVTFAPGVSSRFLLRTLYRGMGIFAVLVVLLTLIPEGSFPRPRVQVFDSRSSKKDPSWMVTLRNEKAELPITPIAQVRRFSVVALLFGLCFLGLLGWIRDRYQLQCRLRGLILLRRFGRVRVAVGPQGGGAYSCLDFWLRPWVVIPESALTHLPTRRMMLLHEAQHHRQGDLIWVTAYALIRRIMFWNPAIWMSDVVIRRSVESLQEFSCDEAVVKRRHSPQEYGHCLIQCVQEAMQGASGVHQQPNFGTTSMATSQHEFLRRRIQMLFQKNKDGLSSRSQMTGIRLIALIALVFGALGSYSLYSMVGSTQAVTVEQVQALIAKTPPKDPGMGTIPIVVNDLVVARLNRFLNTWEGRKFVQESSQRMKAYQKMIREKLDFYQLPQELIAMPFFESGFQNDAVSPAPARSAGIWQFVAATARRYGLKVAHGIDERKIPEKETVAAMKYLGKLHRQFQDWSLAIKAYNEGEGSLEALIAKYQTSDAWKLERIDSREGYLTGVMASLILIQYPEIAQGVKIAD